MAFSLDITPSSPLFVSCKACPIRLNTDAAHPNVDPTTNDVPYPLASHLWMTFCNIGFPSCLQKHIPPHKQFSYMLAKFTSLLFVLS